MFNPPFSYWPNKPTLVGAPANITYGQKFAVQYDAVYNRVRPSVPVPVWWRMAHISVGMAYLQPRPASVLLMCKPP